MKTTSKTLCRIVSVLGLICALFCLWYVVEVAVHVSSLPVKGDRPLHFFEWYVVFSAISVLIAGCVGWGSVGLARLQLGGVRLLTMSSLAAFAVGGIVSMLWLSPMGMSIAAATGVGLGGLTPMTFSLLPLWAGLLWRFAFTGTEIPA